MKGRRNRSGKLIAGVVGVTLAVVLVPFLVSRFSAPGRRIQIHSPNNLRPAERQLLRVATYNIAHGRGLAESNWDGGGPEARLERLQAIAELLREIDADVVVLNEVDFDCSWSHGVNQAEFLAEQAGYPNRVEQRNLDLRVLGWRWKHGNAVLSKYPISSAFEIEHPGYSAWETAMAGQKRGVICHLWDGAEQIRVIAAHLCHRSEDVRVESARGLLGAGYDPPFIIAGDLNSTPPDFPRSATAANGENAIAVLDASNFLQRRPMVAPAAAERTFRSQAPVTTIDWILIPREWEFESYRVEHSLLSDHRPVVANIRMRAKTPD